MNFFVNLGNAVKVAILALASWLTRDHAPGVASLILLLVLIVAVVVVSYKFRLKRQALALLSAKITSQYNMPHEFREVCDKWAKGAGAEKGPKRDVAHAWAEFSETLIWREDRPGENLRNPVRPSAFLNMEDLHFTGGFSRIIPGLFVSVGLSLTFLGLIAALNNMGSGTINDATMANLLKIASAKFIMSLSGLLCSIVFTAVFRVQMSRLERQVNDLCQSLEKKLTFVSLEFLGYEQLETLREVTTASQSAITQAVADLGKPLHEDLPRAISSSIATSMGPLIDQIGRQGSDSMQGLASDLSHQITSSIGAAMTDASQKLLLAGERIGALSERMDLSSGRIGSEMETAIRGVHEAVAELRDNMTASAADTADIFSEGAEKMMSVMNKTLEGIRENTAEGAKAMQDAAAQLGVAATGMRSEMEQAARSGAEAAKHRMNEAGVEARDAICSAAVSVLESFGKAGVEIVTLAGGLSEKLAREVIDPLAQVGKQMEIMVDAIDDGAVEMRAASGAVRDGALAGAEAAEHFRLASQQLVGAALPIRTTVEKMEGSLTTLQSGMSAGLDSISKSAELTAQSAADIVHAARTALASERGSIEAAMEGISRLLQQMRGQGERLDTIDGKLGAAFDLYIDQTEKAMQGLRTHVETMASKLSEAVGQMDNVVMQLQDFVPEQKGR